ncbi:MAG TPA: hypothetical protein VKC60_17675, partial [Opitutaceae bacterium]|nr:hypothetical protein [Opitutaceae bacterium]
ITPGWNPAAPYYYDIRQYVQTYAAGTTPLFSDHNYEDAYYGSHIAEFFNHRLGLLFGGRYQKYNNTRIFPASAAAIPYNVAAKVWTLGLSWEIIPDLVFFASESTSFEPNGGSTIGGNGATTAELTANPVPPVLGRGHDIGIKYNLNRKVALSLSYFNLVRDNDFKTVNTDKTANDPRNNDANPNNDVTWYVIGGERLSRGVDFQVNYRPTDNWQGLFTVGWLPVAKITQNPIQAIPVMLGNGTMGIDPNVDNAVGLRQTNAPRFKFATWNQYVVPGGVFEKLRAGFGVIYTSSVALTTNRTTPEYVPAFATVRVSIGYPIKVFGRQIDTQFVVGNLFDKQFYRSTSRGEPRTFSLNASTKF